MVTFTIQEVYEYKVEAETAEQAQEIFEQFMSDDEEHDVTFTQNYMYVLDQEGNEV
jgi:hypothetical protein